MSLLFRSSQCSNAVRSFATSTGPTRMTAKQAAAAQRSFSLRLYKAILRSHKRMLPAVMRDIGDAYVRDEFKRHKDAKPEHLNSFFREWLAYLDQMKNQGESGFGAPMKEDQLTSLSKEQQQQLEQLKKEAGKAGEYARQLAAEYSSRMMSQNGQSVADSDMPLPISAIDENNAPVEPTSSTDPFASTKRQ